MTIKICALAGVTFRSTPTNIVVVDSRAVIQVFQKYLQLAEERGDTVLGLDDYGDVTWEARTDYTRIHLPHYLNYFMVHIVGSYLQTGGY